MISFRLNKEGKEVPSVIDTGYVNYTQVDYSTFRDRYPHLHDARNDPGGWLPRAPTTLARETSLGAPACSLVQKPSIFTPNSTLPRPHNQEELNLFLVRMNRFTPGDIITFSAYPSNGPMVGFTTMTYILGVDRMIEDVVWNEKESDPKPFLVLDLTPLLPNSESKMSARYISCLFNRHITADERRQHITNNVLLPNYIQQAKDALKAGTLTIKG